MIRSTSVKKVHTKRQPNKYGEHMTIQTADTVVHGGTVAFSSNAYEASIAIKGEHIVAVGTADMMPRADN
ncbi:uncharacterized protein METZ01_LOCUS123665 [marine metagenome]|uniref:Uncharacterized protein n=1 Tax=marine metagenome TaxID=408172 RepID=A0A381Y2B9_9ZZZZ